MYYPIGWAKCAKVRLKSKVLKRCNSDGEEEEELIEECLTQICPDSDRDFFYVLTNFSVRIWSCKPSAEIVSHTRDAESLITFGFNLDAAWRLDSTTIVVRTSKDYLLFYRVLVKSNQPEVLIQNDVSSVRREGFDYFGHEKIPARFLELAFSNKIPTGISSMMAAEEEVVVATRSGHISGVNWDGTLDFNFQWSLKGNVNDQQDDTFYAIDIKYSNMVGGFALVLANGKAAFLPLFSAGEEEEQSLENGNAKFCLSHLQFVEGVDNAVVTNVNHKYQLLTFGLRNGEVILCCTNEADASVVITHRFTLSASACPGAPNLVGSLHWLAWSPDSTVLAVSWKNRGFALWSVFGSLLCCSLQWDYGTDKAPVIAYRSLAWAKEGFQLWALEQTLNNEGEEKDICKLTQLSLAKSVLACNPSCICTCSEHVLLLSEDRLYLGIGCSKGEERKQTANSEPENIDTLDELDEPYDVGNHQWVVIPLPHTYIRQNAPIRFAAMDGPVTHVAIAGRTGFAYYSLITRRWKLFGNETQERDFEVCGGLLWWSGHIVLGCFNKVEGRFELRVYSQRAKLDTRLARIIPLPAEALLLSVYRNKLLVLLVDNSFHLFALLDNGRNYSAVQNDSGPASLPTFSNSVGGDDSSATVLFLNQIIVNNVVVSPECVTSILLSPLHLEARPNENTNLSHDSILMNVCGRLFLLEFDSMINDPRSSCLVYRAVSILASGVENVWLNPQPVDSTGKRPHLTNALWLACGANGMSVWLPLLPSQENNLELPGTRQSRSFISKRIMLPINTHIYPLAVLFRDALVLGAENDTILCGRTHPINRPYSAVCKTSQVYLHHILWELLRRNLGMHAWEIANSCASLPYFPHSLELLLHEVLEEEATSSQAIPDPLLPRVIDFIREFPFFLETIVHCARKTELALWPHLFSVVGDPKELFQRCLDTDRLQTAASYVIVLHNLETTSISKQYAMSLLEAATERGQLRLSKELLRFLHAIEPSEAGPISPHSGNASSAPKKSVPRVEGPHSRKLTLSSSVELPHLHAQLANSLHLQSKGSGSGNASTNTTSTNRKRTQSASSTGALSAAASIGSLNHSGNGQLSCVPNNTILTNGGPLSGTAYSIPHVNGNALAVTLKNGAATEIKSEKDEHSRTNTYDALPGKVWPSTSETDQRMNSIFSYNLDSNGTVRNAGNIQSRRHSVAEEYPLSTSACKLQ